MRKVVNRSLTSIKIDPSGLIFEKCRFLGKLGQQMALLCPPGGGVKMEIVEKDQEGSYLVREVIGKRLNID